MEVPCRIAVPALILLTGLCLATQRVHATESAIVVIYQPILTVGEATVIQTPKGFAVLAVPFECFPYQDHPPYSAVALGNSLLSSAPEMTRQGDKNVASMAGIKIDTPYEENLVNVHFENLQPLDLFDFAASTDDIAEGTIECIRRMAAEAKEHPRLHITGKQGEESKWARWEKGFASQNMQKKFVRPKG